MNFFSWFGRKQKVEKYVSKKITKIFFFLQETKMSSFQIHTPNKICEMLKLPVVRKY